MNTEGTIKRVGGNQGLKGNYSGNFIEGNPWHQWVCYQAFIPFIASVEHKTMIFN